MWRKRRRRRSCWSEVVTARRGAHPARISCDLRTVGIRMMVPPKSQPKRPRTVPPSIGSSPKWVRLRARRLPRRRSRLRCAVITACFSVSICFRLDLHTVARPVLHRCETGALFHVLVILGVAVPKFIHSPFFYPCSAISFAGIVALIHYCIGCTGGASIACWLHWWCIVSHASHTIRMSGSAAAGSKNKPKFCMCLPVIILAACFRLHFAVWFAMHQRMT